MPKLKFKLTKPEFAALDDSRRDLYTEKDGVYVLDAEGAVDETEYDAVESKLGEFRDNNRKLFTKTAEYESTLKRYEGVDPDEFKRLKETAGKGVSQTDIERAVTAAVEKTRDTLEKRLQAVEAERDTERRKNEDIALEQALWSVAHESIHESARTDFVRRAKDVFVLENGTPVAKRGDDPIYSKQRGKTSEPLSVEEFVTGPEWLRKDAAHLYKESSGQNAKQNSRQPQMQNGMRVIPNDPDSIARNLDGIAKGTVIVAA